MIAICDYSIYCIPAGWRTWVYLQVIDESGNHGIAEATESNGFPTGMVSAISDSMHHLIGEKLDSPKEVRELLTKRHRQSLGGLGSKAISAIENACWDLWSRLENTPIPKLIMGEHQSHASVFVYWSHCGTSRIRAWNHVQKPPITTRNDLQAFSREIAAADVRAFKTNLFRFSAIDAQVLMPGFGKPNNSTSLIGKEYISELKKNVQALRHSLSGETETILDLNYNVDLKDFSFFEDALSNLETRWIEIDFDERQPLAKFKSQKSIKICSGENLIGLENYKSIINSDYVDIISIDLLWNGISESISIAEEVLKSGKQFTIHNYYSHLSTFMSLTFLSMFKQFELLEFDFDDVGLRDSIFSFSSPYLPNRGALQPIVHGLGWNYPELDANKIKEFQLKK